MPRDRSGPPRSAAAHPAPPTLSRHRSTAFRVACCPSLAPLLQFVYAKAVGTFPFNAFLAGFFCCVGSFVLTLSLRMKVSESGGATAAQEFGGYALAMCTLFIASWNYIG